MDGMSNNWGSMDGVGNWGMDGVGNNWGVVGNNWGSVDGVSSHNWGMVGNNWGSMDGMGNWGMDGVSNNWGSVDSMSSMNNWGVVGHSNGWSNVWGKVTSRDNSTSMGDGSVVSYIRGGESGGEAEEGGDNKSLKI